jgi:hypothetical protein
MKKAYVNCLFAALLGFAPIPASFATTDSPSESQAISEQALEQILAPIALYPDALLSQILMASTYPLEVVQAARWSRGHPGLQGQEAVKAVNDRDWDPSVKSMVAFPQILQMMDEKLDWTDRLGDAFLAQPAQVTDTVQALRGRAYAAGNLRSTDHYRVERRDRIIVVESPRPDVVYVPYYDPYVVYGSWRWAAYPPVRWAAWPGYVHAGFVGFRWSVGITIGPRFFFGAFDWPRRHVAVVNVNTFYYPRPVQHRTVVVRETVWHHDPRHRHGVPYRDAHVRHRYVNAPQVRHDRVVAHPAARDHRPDNRRDDRDYRNRHNTRDNHGQRPQREFRHDEHGRSAQPRDVRAPERLMVAAPKASTSPSVKQTNADERRPDRKREERASDRRGSFDVRRAHGEPSRRQEGGRFQVGARAQRD